MNDQAIRLKVMRSIALRRAVLLQRAIASGSLTLREALLVLAPKPVQKYTLGRIPDPDEAEPNALTIRPDSERSAVAPPPSDDELRTKYAPLLGLDASDTRSLDDPLPKLPEWCNRPRYTVGLVEHWYPLAEGKFTRRQFDALLVERGLVEPQSTIRPTPVTRPEEAHLDRQQRKALSKLRVRLAEATHIHATQVERGAKADAIATALHYVEQARLRYANKLREFGVNQSQSITTTTGEHRDDT